MKLLLDENLSRRLVPFLSHDFPESTHVTLVGLQSVSDRELWDYAKSNGYVLVTLDSDFQDLSILLGSPPQVIWIRSKNPRRAVLLKLILDSKKHIFQELEQERSALIQLQGEQP